jgi:hypothetical protein
LIVAVICAALIFPLVIAIWHGLNTTSITLDGKTTRMSKDEVARLMEKRKEADDLAAQPKPPPTANPDPTTAPYENVAKEPSPAQPLEGDSQILVRELSNQPSELGQEVGYILGTVRNEHDQACRTIGVTVQPRNKKGLAITKVSTDIGWVPAHGSARFSVPYTVFIERAAELEAAGKAELASADVLCWVVDADNYSFENSPQGTAILSGKIKNMNDFAIRNVAICADIFSREGVCLESVQGKLEPQDLDSGKTGQFSVSCSPKVNRAVVTQVIVRAAGRKGASN